MALQSQVMVLLAGIYYPEGYKMLRRVLMVSLGAMFALGTCAYSNWLEISNVKASQYPTELAGPKIIFE